MYKVGYILEMVGHRLPNFTHKNRYEIELVKQDESILLFDDSNNPVIFSKDYISEYFELVVNEDKTNSTTNDLIFFNKTKDEFGLKVEKVLSNVGNMLIEKNRKYGNSALEPVRIFSKMTKDEQLKVRIDDKLSRISSSQLDEDEDVIADLIGYLVLLKIAKEN